MKYISFVFSGVIAGMCLAGCRPALPRLGEASLDEVVSALTLEEKARLVVGTGMTGFTTGDSAIVAEIKNQVPGAGGTTFAVPRLGIPSIVLADGPAGLRISPTRDNDTATYYCTYFPIGTLLASSWNTGLVEKVGQAIGNEVLEYGVDILLAPALNIHRNPLCGRNFEYYSEDPLVSGQMAAAYVRGVQQNGVGTTVKHFAVNNQETNRKANNALVSQRALREIYLKGFEIAVKEAEPWCVMSSYPYINGVYASENPWLLTTVLRQQWGFKGFVMTDWFGGKDALAQMKAGNDMLQPGLSKQYTDLVEGVKSGALPEEVLNRNVKNILSVILKTPKFKGYAYSNKPDLKAHARITRELATEGMVLLKNDRQALPLASDIRTVALFGCTSYDFISGGTGSGSVNGAYTVSLLKGLQNAGVMVDDGLRQAYLSYLESENRKAGSKSGQDKFKPVSRPDEMRVDPALLRSAVAQNQVALVTIGRSSGEFLDRRLSDFSLSANELALLREVSEAFHRAGKKVVVVLNIGGVIETASWKKWPDAILCAWQAGQEGGNSVADILFGKATPSGKLTMTFPNRLTDHASTANFPIDKTADIGIGKQGEKRGTNEKDVDYTNYAEGIYVGYRWFDKQQIEVSYPFGYGLSYTSFHYSLQSLSKEGPDAYTVRVNVTNTGTCAGKEIVQLYVQAPAGKKDKPVRELKGFAKTKSLAVGESQQLKLRVSAADLASFDETQGRWVVDAGQYVLSIGASSRDLRIKVEVQMPARVYDL